MNAELVAIIEAIEYAIRINKLKLVILTDSQSSCLKLLNKHNADNYLIRKLFSLIFYNNFEELVIQWIPGHINLLGNERADAAAKLGVNRAIQENYPITLGDCLLNFKTELTTEWNREYIELSKNKGTQHYQIMDEIKLKPWYNDLNLSTTETIAIGRIRTFHTATKDRLTKWKLVNSDTCNNCNVQENLIHLLFDCTRYTGIRRKFPVLSNKENFKKVLKGKKQDEYTQIAEFIGEAEINV